jgi:hypothetical protein
MWHWAWGWCGHRCLPDAALRYRRSTLDRLPALRWARRDARDPEPLLIRPS